MTKSDRAGYYLSLTDLSNTLVATSLSTERGPIFVKLEEGRLVLFDWDGKELAVIKGTRHG